MTHSKNKAKCLAVLGTASDVGKSVAAAALCRILSDRGVRVCPFKAQNMSNNSGVTPEGLEMGRAQIVQAEAARTAPHVDMNPVLLKPTGEAGSQVVLLGRAIGNRAALDYYKEKDHLFGEAKAALARLRGQYDAVVLEGAGSCAEVNLFPHDFVNMRMAETAEAPVVLVADIHRGGVFAQIVGTLACLPPEHRARVAGFLVNRFRGDTRLFEGGAEWLEQRTGKPCFGVIPWFTGFRIEAEDSVALENPAFSGQGNIHHPAVAVVRLPRISNFTDFDALRATPGLRVHFCARPVDLSHFAAVILPGTKNTREDLEWLWETGWAKEILDYHAKGGHVLGVCGGYQMLGREVRDPEGHEGEPGETRGLGLLPVTTILAAPKTTTRTRFAWDGAEGEGYEIHMGRTEREGGTPLFQVLGETGMEDRNQDGCVSEDGRAAGTYMHGLFDQFAVLDKWLASIGLPEMEPPRASGLAMRDIQYGLLAEHFRAHADVPAMLGLLGIG
jgi:adenosylcobyric acid synthase